MVEESVHSEPWGSSNLQAHQFLPHSPHATTKSSTRNLRFPKTIFMLICQSSTSGSSFVPVMHAVLRATAASKSRRKRSDISSSSGISFRGQAVVEGNSPSGAEGSRSGSLVHSAPPGPDQAVDVGISWEEQQHVKYQSRICPIRDFTLTILVEQVVQ